GASPLANLLADEGGVFGPQQHRPGEFSGSYRLSNRIGLRLVHGRHWYIWSAVCCAANIELRYEYCCCMEAIMASAADMPVCRVTRNWFTLSVRLEMSAAREASRDWVSVSACLRSPLFESSRLLRASVAAFKNPPPVADPRNEDTPVELVKS